MRGGYIIIYNRHQNTLVIKGGINIIKVDKRGIANILDVKKEGLKTIEKNNNLEIRLEEKGYKLLDRYKEGKKIYYNLDQISENKEVLNNICNITFKTKQEEKLKNYIIIRSDFSNYPLSKKKIADVVGVGTKTIAKWDNIMLNNKYMFKDGFFYMKVEKLDDGKYIVNQVDKWEYNTYWKNKIKTKLYKSLQEKYINGSITLDEFTLAIDEIATLLNMIDNKYYYKIAKYKINDDNKLFKDIYNLFLSVYGNENIEIEFELIE